MLIALIPRLAQVEGIRFPQPEILMSDPVSSARLPRDPTYMEPDGVPFVYFDVAAAHGTLSGAVQIELVARVMIPLADGKGVEIRFVPTARLRCSPAAIKSLRISIDAALAQLEEPQQQPPASASTLN
jgi:hypothetical protein